MCTGGDPLSADDVATPRGLLDDGGVLEMALDNSLSVVTRDTCFYPHVYRTVW